MIYSDGQGQIKAEELRGIVKNFPVYVKIITPDDEFSIDVETAEEISALRAYFHELEIAEKGVDTYLREQGLDPDALVAEGLKVVRKFREAGK